MVDGVRFPENLNNPTAVAFVLNQTPGHLKARELKSGSAAATIAKQIGEIKIFYKIRIVVEVPC